MLGFKPEQWRDRERVRNQGGYALEDDGRVSNWLDATRTLPVWVNAPWWRENVAIHRDHYLHVSTTNPALLAYTTTEDKGQRDIQTPIKPGRYLRQFFAGVLTEKQIAAMAAWQLSGERPTDKEIEDRLALRIATHGDEMVEVYKHGPASCMTGEDCVRVYAAGDLAIAYLHDTGEEPAGRLYPARALVWPARKIIGRVYPTPDRWREDGFPEYEAAQEMHDRLTNRLRAEGYVPVAEASKDFSGARIAKEEGDCGRYAMPYLDGSYGLNDDGDCFVMSHSGEYSGDSTEGWIETDEADERSFCSNCEEYGDDDDMAEVRTRNSGGYQMWCEGCRDADAFMCTGLGEWFSDRCDSVTIDDETYSETYANRQGYFWCDKTEAHYWDSEGSVDMGCGDTWSSEAFADHGFTCKLDGENYPNDEMHDDFPGYHSAHDEADIREHMGLDRDGGTIHDDNQLELVA